MPMNEAFHNRASNGTLAPGDDGFERRLRFAVGSDFLEDFVASHTPSDMLRELVQNEYDAGGSKLDAVFDEHELRVTGNGSPIDSAGWRRLSVMFSTGRITGSGDGPVDVEPKVNGIGSKNAGLRTLFLLGDRIQIRSNGKFTVLDLRKGTLPVPEAHPASRNKRGVEILVPYRRVDTKLLQAFDREAESEALESFSTEVAEVLLKLAQPGTRRNLTHMAVSSKRHGRRISWTQNVSRQRGRAPGVKVVRRQIRRYDARGSSDRRRSEIDELEFQRLVIVPPQHRSQVVPGYFRHPNRSVRVSLSVRLRGEQPELGAAGLFYYLHFRTSWF